jgi:hypothetical protein
MNMRLKRKSMPGVTSAPGAKVRLGDVLPIGLEIAIGKEAALKALGA